MITDLSRRTMPNFEWLHLHLSGSRSVRFRCNATASLSTTHVLAGDCALGAATATRDSPDIFVQVYVIKLCNKLQTKHLFHRSPPMSLPSLVTAVCIFWDILVDVVVPARTESSLLEFAL
jgi:hypothetical protein